MTPGGKEDEVKKILKINQGKYFISGNSFPDPQGHCPKKRYYEPP